MKNAIGGIALFLSFLFISSSLRAQLDAFNAGMKLGVAGTQISGDGYRGFRKAGPVGGFFVSRQFTEKWGGLMEIQYIRKGSFDPPDPENGKFDSYKIDLQYVELPIMATFELSKFLWEAGVSMGYLFSHRQEDEFGPIREEDVERFIQMRDYEFAFNLGLNFQISEKLYLNARYSRSIYPIANHPQWVRGYIGLFGGSYNQTLQFTLGYHILGKNHAYDTTGRQKEF